MLPQEFMEKVSHRWYRTIERDSQDEWNRPSRSDNYLMQIAQRIQQVMRKDPGKIKLAMQKIKFTFKKPVAPPKLTEAEKIAAATAVAQSQWDRRVGR